MQTKHYGMQPTWNLAEYDICDCYENEIQIQKKNSEEIRQKTCVHVFFGSPLEIESKCFSFLIVLALEFSLLPPSILMFIHSLFGRVCSFSGRSVILV